jgi:curved DNA-binding protein
MNEEQPFIDYYAVLQIDPGCSSRLLDAAYRHWAKQYHPDHTETADVEKFNLVIEAYRVLRDGEKRAEYDRLHAQHVHGGAPFAMPSDEFEVEEQVALDDADTQARILMLLYKRRRENAGKAGIGGFFIQEMLGCSEEIFEFHRWYLKSKNWIEITEEGSLAITIDGIDHVIAMSRSNKVEKLLIGQSKRTDD